MKSKMLAVFSALVLLFSGSLMAGGHGHHHKTDAELAAHNAWVRLVPPVSNISAAYMMLHNNGGQDQVISGATSPVAADVEVHETSMKDGVMRMSEAKNLTVPAAGHIMMKPGGYHIMLINLKRPLKEGELVPITINFQSGQALTLEAPVKAAPMGQGMKHHKH